MTCAVGSAEPLIPGHVGCILLKADGSRVLARVQPDPLAQQGPTDRLNR